MFEMWLGSLSQHQGPRTCYAFGQYFLTHLYDAIGLSTFSSAMRELYERHLDCQYHPSEEQVYRIFLKHTPPDREAAFPDVYRRLHGRAVPRRGMNGNAAALGLRDPVGYDAGSCREIPALTGCAPRGPSSTGSRRSLSPRALATFNSVARVGLPSSDSAS